MDCTQPPTANPIEQFISCFETAQEAAASAGVSYEMLRRMRHRGYVTTRDRAITMAAAARNRITPAQLLALPGRKREARA